MKTFAALVGVVAVAGFGFAQSLVVVPKGSAVQEAAAVPQAAVSQPQFQAGGVSQTFPGGTPLSTIHIQVAGTPMAGSYVAFEEIASGYEFVIVGGVKERNRRVWTATMQSNADANANGGVYVQRTIHPDLSITWTGGGAFGPSGRGAFSGRVWSPEVTTGGMFELFGTDFNCSGGSGFVGNPAYGGGGNITLTVSP